MTRSLLATALWLAASANCAAVELPEAASTERPIAVLSMYSADAFAKVIAAGAAHKVFKDVRLFIGQYGISPAQAKDVHALPNALYAPIFTPRREDHPTRLHLTKEDKEKLAASANARPYEGKIPSDLLGVSHEEQRMWGVELGRRLRDGIRAHLRAGVKIDSWQFDEVSPTPAGKVTPRGVASRWFISGALHGLAYGRPELDDKKMSGLVFIAQTRKFSELPDTEDARMLMWELDHVALAIMGEEYPLFRGDPKEAARRAATGQRNLRAAGGVRARLASRYVPAMTPGYNVWNAKGEWSHLNGNADGRSDAWVNEWRGDFVAERVNQGAAGLGEYNFSKNNSRPAVVRATVTAVAQGISRLLRRPDAPVLVASRR